MSVKQINGNFLVYRKAKRGFKRAGQKNGAGGLPRFRHPDMESASAEATRLLGLFPDSTFIIMQEVATVKVRDGDSERIAQPPKGVHP